MKRIEDVKSPEVGKFYLVRCIDHPNVKGNHRWLPVIGPWHEDAEIVGFSDHHFHYDWRQGFKKHKTDAEKGREYEAAVFRQRLMRLPPAIRELMDREMMEVLPANRNTL